MKTNIKYSVFDLLLWVIGVAISLTAVIVLLKDGNDDVRRTWAIIGYGIFLLFSLLMLLCAIQNIQWFDVAGGYITVRCLFGVVKRVTLDKIKQAFQHNATIFRIRMAGMRRPHIVLCLRKSVTKASIDDAYNRREKPYIIIPYSPAAERLLQAEYKKHCGSDLNIK